MLHLATGALYRSNGGILIVKPTYRDYWLLPGGHVEAGESPRDALAREVKEELGFQTPIGPLLCVDYWATGQQALAAGRTQTKESDTLVFIFDGGRLTSADLDAITLPSDELEDFAVVPEGVARERLAPYYSGRLSHALAALEGEAVVYLEGGVRVGERGAEAR